MLKTFYQKHRSVIHKLDGVLLRNTVLERGLVLAPIIVAANTGANALLLGVSFLLITFCTLALSSFVSKAMPYTFRVILYVIIACLLYIPIHYFGKMLFPQTVFQVGIFLPLLVTNSLIVTKSETRFFKKSKPAMLLDVLSFVLGFFVVILLVGWIREWFAAGTWMGFAVPHVIPFTAFSLPFGGFVTVAFLSAGLHKIRNHLADVEKEKAVRS